VGHFTLKVRAVSTNKQLQNDLLEECYTSEDFKKGFTVYLYNKSQKIIKAWDSEGVHLQSMVGADI